MELKYASCCVAFAFGIQSLIALVAWIARAFTTNPIPIRIEKTPRGWLITPQWACGYTSPLMVVAPAFTIAIVQTLRFFDGDAGTLSGWVVVRSLPWALNSLTFLAYDAHITFGVILFNARSVGVLEQIPFSTALSNVAILTLSHCVPAADLTLLTLASHRFMRITKAAKGLVEPIEGDFEAARHYLRASALVRLVNITFVAIPALWCGIYLARRIQDQLSVVRSLRTDFSASRSQSTDPQSFSMSTMSKGSGSSARSSIALSINSLRFLLATFISITVMRILSVAQAVYVAIAPEVLLGGSDAYRLTELVLQALFALAIVPIIFIALVRSLSGSTLTGVKLKGRKHGDDPFGVHRRASAGSLVSTNVHVLSRLSYAPNHPKDDF